MKNFNYTSKKIEVSDLSKDHIANAGIIHYKSWFNVKTRNPALLMIVVLVIVSLTSCYGMLRVQDSNHSDRHNGNEGNEGRQGREHRDHDNRNEHNNLNYIQPSNYQMAPVSASGIAT